MIRALLSKAHFRIIIIKTSHFLCITWAFSGSNTGYSCCSASQIGLQSSKCENCGTKIHNSQRVCSKEPPKGESNWASSGKKKKRKKLAVSGSLSVSEHNGCLQAMSCIFNLFFSEFHYRYNTPGQNFFNHTERSAFARLRYLNENNSSPSKYISCMIPSL